MPWAVGMTRVHLKARNHGVKAMGHGLKEMLGYEVGVINYRALSGS